MNTASRPSRFAFHFTSSALLALLITSPGCKDKPPAPTNTSAPPVAATASTGVVAVEKTSFAAVTSKLDPGGSVFVYLNTAQWLDGLSVKLGAWRDDLLSVADLPEEELAMARNGFNLGMKLVQRSGLESVDGVGLSGIAIGDGLYQTKIVASHSAQAPASGIWTVFGRQPHALSALDLLPTNTAWVAFSDVDAAGIWSALATEMNQSGIARLQEGTAQLGQMLAAATGMSPDQLLGSLGGEVGALLTLNDQQMIPIPIGDGDPVQIPEPQLALVFSVKDDRLFDWLDGKLKDNPEVVRTDEAGLRLRVMPVPLPLPVQIRASVARFEDKLIFATHDELIRAMIAVKTGTQPGLRSNDEFARLARGMPDTGNSFSYVSRRFGDTVQNVQMDFLKASAGMSGGAGPAMLFQKFAGLNGGVAAYSVAQNTGDAWVTTMHGTQEPATAVMLPLVVAPTAMVAGAMLPALAKAKSKAQSVSCINNLKQLGLAARIYANDNGDRPPPNLAALEEILVTTKALVCPSDQERLALPLPDWADVDEDSSSYDYLGRSFESLPGDTDRVLFRCRIHGHACHADGSVRQEPQ